MFGMSGLKISQKLSYCPRLGSRMWKLKVHLHKGRRYESIVKQKHLLCAIQARRQDLAAGGGLKPERGATFLKYCAGCMQQSGGQPWNGGAPLPPAGDGPGAI